ncbi:MAG: hypothetical protein KAG66_21140, partial [Methylococcales bacterium]|nr:hypothetical protein [Methylococcales bacterium]
MSNVLPFPRSTPNFSTDDSERVQLDLFLDYIPSAYHVEKKLCYFLNIDHLNQSDLLSEVYRNNISALLDLRSLRTFDKPRYDLR